MDAICRCTEHALTHPGGMEMIPFAAWLQLRLVARALYQRFRTVAVPAFLAYLHERIITAVLLPGGAVTARGEYNNGPDPHGTRDDHRSPVIVSGSLVTTCVLGRSRGSTVRLLHGTPVMWTLNVYIPFSELVPRCFARVCRVRSMADGQQNCYHEALVTAKLSDGAGRSAFGSVTVCHSPGDLVDLAVRRFPHVYMMYTVPRAGPVMGQPIEPVRMHKLCTQPREDVRDWLWY